jgi:integrase/recombinase XerD
MSQVALVNRYLKELAIQAGIEKHLTSHLSRHFFASRALRVGVSHAAIKKGLKHGSISTTERYLRSLPSDLIDEGFRSASF